MKIDVTVNQKPVSVSFDCPHCEEEIEIEYQDFSNELGEPCDWEYSKVKCPKCGKTTEIGSVEWD